MILLNATECLKNRKLLLLFMYKNLECCVKILEDPDFVKEPPFTEKELLDITQDLRFLIGVLEDIK